MVRASKQAVKTRSDTQTITVCASIHTYSQNRLENEYCEQDVDTCKRERRGRIPSIGACATAHLCARRYFKRLRTISGSQTATYRSIPHPHLPPQSGTHAPSRPSSPHAAPWRGPGRQGTSPATTARRCARQAAARALVRRPAVRPCVIGE